MTVQNKKMETGVLLAKHEETGVDLLLGVEKVAAFNLIPPDYQERWLILQSAIWQRVQSTDTAGPARRPWRRAGPSVKKKPGGFHRTSWLKCAKHICP